MTLTLELTPEQEQQIEAEAQSRNMDMRSYALTRLMQPDYGMNVGNEEYETLPEPGSLTPAQTVAYWESKGILRPRPDLPDSPVYARQLRDEAETRGQK